MTVKWRSPLVVKNMSGLIPFVAAAIPDRVVQDLKDENDALRAELEKLREHVVFCFLSKIPFELLFDNTIGGAGNIVADEDTADIIADCNCLSQFTPHFVGVGEIAVKTPVQTWSRSRDIDGKFFMRVYFAVGDTSLRHVITMGALGKSMVWCRYIIKNHREVRCRYE